VERSFAATEELPFGRAPVASRAAVRALGWPVAGHARRGGCMGRRFDQHRGEDVMTAEVTGLALERMRYVEVAPHRARIDAVSARAHQHWDVIDDQGRTIARAEVFEGREQWGVRLFDEAPHLDDSDLLRVVAHLLVWHAQCRTDTVDVVLARTNEHHTLVRVNGDYV
jgi:hypothetical protein